MTADCECAPAAANPWDRFGPLMAYVWLGFLLVPVIDVVRADRSLGWQALGLATIAAFGATYVLLFSKSGSGAFVTDDVSPGAWKFSALLVAIAGVAIPILGLSTALAFTPYLVAAATFGLPMRAGVITGTLLTVSVAALWYWTDTALGLIIPCVAILVVGSIVRLSVRRGVAFDVAQEELRMAQERDRVARDVHDVLGHTLTAVAAKAQLAEALVTADPDRAQAEIREIHALSRAAMSEVRETVTGLRVTNLTDELYAAETALSAAGVALRVVGQPMDLDPRHRVVAAWLVRECATNIVRHAQASSCAVAFAPDSVTVTDDGVGIAEKRRGNGLHGLRERITNSGGAVAVSSSGRGTEVSASWEST